MCIVSNCQLAPLAHGFLSTFPIQAAHVVASCEPIPLVITHILLLLSLSHSVSGLKLYLLF